MNLSETQIKQLIEKPKHRRELEASKLHNQRLAFHSDIVLRIEDASDYYSKFIYWVGQLLPKDKTERIKQLLTFPLCTNELMKDIFMGLERVWYAKDFFERYTFASEEYEQSFEAYRKRIKCEHMWKVEGWSSLKTCIDSVVIVDLPETQSSNRPEPYFYFISPEEIIDLEVDEKNDMQYIIFEHDNAEGVDELIVYDDTYMRKYAYKDKKIGAQIAEVEHGLGYCPARMFWSDKLQDENYINKRSPITDSLGDLDWLLFFKTSKKYLDLHAPYPIYITYDIVSDEKTEGNDQKKTWYEGQEATDTHKGKGFMGPGSFSTVPPPRPGDNVDMMSNPIQVVSAETEACQYSSDEVERLENDIYESCVGSNGTVLGKEAVNEKQVESNLLSAQDVLVNLSRNLAEIMLWTHETLARLQYGVFFIGGVVSFGEDFFLEKESDLMDQYADAKQKGINPIMLDALDERLLDIRYKNHPRLRERASIFKDLDPLPGMTVAEAADLIGKGVSVADLTIKASLLKFVKMFELDYGDIVDYQANNYAKKINEILTKFREYVNENNAWQPQPGLPV